MADRTLTVNGQPFTFNRDRFAGVRTMTVNGETVTVDRTAQVIDSDRKGESRPLLSKVVGGAAAAYSLRDLNDKQGNNKVVRVRRSSDNHERDFLAKEVSNGTLQNWVNTQVVAPLDIKALADSDGDENDDGRVGDFLIAKAAYSLRSLGTRQATIPNDAAPLNEDTVVPASGKYVVQVRRNVDEKIKSFTATEVSDGTLESFVNESFTSSLPLDVAGSAAAAYGLRNLKTGGTSVTSSGDTGGDTTGKFVVQVRRSSDDTIKSFTAAEITDGTLTDFVNVSKDYVGSARFQNTNTSSVSLSSSFTLEATNSWSIKFGYIGGDAATGLFGSSSASLTGFWTASSDIMGITDDSGYYAGLNFGAELAIKLGKHYELEFFNTPSEGVRVIVDGVTMTTAPKIYGNITLNQVGESRTRRGNRVIENVRIDLNGDGNLDYSYAGDGNQASNWTDRVGSNNGTPHSSVLTYNNEFTDGFVKTWYDQSGNTNDAVQPTPASQPKIVNAGSLVTGGIDFDGVDDKLSTVGKPLDDLSAVTAFSVANYDGTGSADRVWGSKDSSRSDDNISLLYLTNAMSFKLDNGTSTIANSSAQSSGVNFLSYINYNGETLGSAVDGKTEGTASRASFVTDADVLDIGLVSSTGTTAWDGRIAEIIIYPSDQSAKRRAIEESIATANGITLGSFNRDGFVKTWYDQSVTTEQGNVATGNHAVQGTPASQPKIVSAGSLEADGLLFEGGGQGLATTSAISSTNIAIAFVSKSNDNGFDGIFAMQDYFNDGHELLYVPPNKIQYRLEDSDLEVSTTPTNKNLYFANYDGSTQGLSINGTNNTQSVSTTVAPIGSVSQIGARFDGSASLNGSIEELIVYTSDQSANRTALEANIGEAYSIDLPSGVDSGENQVDGFVETWYDQSGNSEDATQATASAQPKIVDEGALVTDSNNNPEIDFNGSNKFSFVNTVNSSPPYTVLSVSKVRDTGTNVIYGLDTGITAGYYTGSVTKHAIYSGGGETGSAFAINTDYLRFDLFNGSSSVIGVNGDTTNVALNAARNNTGFNIAFSGVNVEQSINGTIKEIILYHSDQSANRPAIEANINNQYDIY